MNSLCTSKNGCEVFVDEQNTNIGLHILENPNLLELAKEAIMRSDVVGEKVALEVDMGRIINTTSMIKIGVDDEIV